MDSIRFRCLEMHSSQLWSWQAIKRTLAFMQKYKLNILVLHQNDLLDELSMPQSEFSDSDMVWKRWPVRRSKTFANAIYMRQVVSLARSCGIDVYLEVKEIWYPDAIIELHPELRSAEGTICPTNSFWFSFLGAKVREVLDTIPDIAGLIVSPATRESRISISTRTCQCARCRSTTDESWYRSYIGAILPLLNQRHKKLVVRDFSYDAQQQTALVSAAASLSNNIVIALKNVPQDFWPTFPDNPVISQPLPLEKWIEFDLWGQYCGIGLFPCSLVEDFQKRLHHALENGACGVIVRTDWEICRDATIFNSMNLLNLIGAAMLCDNPAIDLECIYQAWAAEGLLSPLHADSENLPPTVPQNPQAWKQLMTFMRTSWIIIEKALFMKGFVFQLSSKIQPSVDEILYTMTRHHSKCKWDGHNGDLQITSPDSVRELLQEKAEALALVGQLDSILSPDTLGVPPAFAAELHTLLKLYQLYVRQFELAAKVVCFSQLSPEANALQQLIQARLNLIRLADDIDRELSQTHYAYYVYWLLDASVLRSLADSVEADPAGKKEWRNRL